MKKGQEGRRKSALARHEKQLKSYESQRERLVAVPRALRDGLWDERAAVTADGIRKTEVVIENTKRNLQPDSQ